VYGRSFFPFGSCSLLACCGNYCCVVVIMETKRKNIANFASLPSPVRATVVHLLTMKLTQGLLLVTTGMTCSATKKRHNYSYMTRKTVGMKVSLDKN